ncbi:hypothetical protein AB0C07_35565 [Actinoplanes missouriensis]|uniref:hypothetical protein n=1 Tax=Actinoplanes missouriensis TaxID=1866 RepID=UPI0033DB3D1B
MTQIDAGRFAGLLHAYGPATDTPAHLAALAGGDPAALDAAVGHLWSAIIHQGTPWTATAPAALVVAALVGDPRMSGPARAGLRTDLLGFLAEVAEAGMPFPELTDLEPPPGFDLDAVVAEAVAEGEEDELYGDETTANALYLRAVRDCHAITPRLMEVAEAALSDPDPAVRTSAAHLATVCAVSTSTAQPPTASPSTAPVPPAPSAADSLAARLDALAAGAGPDERAALVLSMGGLGVAPRAYLRDPHPGVRACAALAPGLADDPEATAEILAALADPLAVQSWFTVRPPQFSAHIRFTLIGAAIERVPDPADLLPAALAVVPIAGIHTVDADWGRLLMAFFTGYGGTGQELSSVQRRYLAALVDRAELWVPRNGNAGLVFSRAGLPYDRESCRAMLAS